MTTTNKNLTVYQKLLQVQGNLNAPKSLYNSFGKYSYRSAETILEALKPLLTEVKAVLVIRDSIEQVGDRFYIKAAAQFIDAETGDFIENTALAREEETKKGMDGSQITGAASSYARKYALNGLFCIDDTKDADATNTHGKESDKKTSPPKGQTDQALEVVKKICAELGMSGEDFATFVREKHSKKWSELNPKEKGEVLLHLQGLKGA